MFKKLFFILIFFNFISYGYEFKDFFEELKKVKAENGQIHFVIWIPVEVWAETLEKNSGLGKKEIEEFKKNNEDYLFFIAMIAKEEKDGLIYKSESEITKSIFLHKKGLPKLKPVNLERAKNINRNFIIKLSLLLMEIFGEAGANMHIFLFPAKDKKGKKIADPYKKGEFYIELDGQKFLYTLPLNPLLKK